MGFSEWFNPASYFRSTEPAAAKPQAHAADEHAAPPETPADTVGTGAAPASGLINDTAKEHDGAAPSNEHEETADKKTPAGGADENQTTGDKPWYKTTGGITAIVGGSALGVGGIGLGGYEYTKHKHAKQAAADAAAQGGAPSSAPMVSSQAFPMPGGAATGAGLPSSSMMQVA